MIKAVVFDMDGILIDSEPVNLNIIKEFFKAHGKVASEAYLYSLVGRSIHDTWDLTSSAWGEPISYEDYQELYQGFRKDHPIDYPSILFKDVKEILSWLKQAGYMVAIASSSKMRTIDRVLDACDLQAYFDVKMSGEMFKKSKPNPEIYIKTAEKLGYDVSQCLGIEDSKAGIAACLAAHMPVVAKIDLRYGADPNLANYQIHDLMEIKNILETINT